MRNSIKLTGRLILRRHLAVVISVALLTAGLLVLWAGNLQYAYIPPNFSYSADIAVTGNDYDSANHRYSDSRSSVGNYYVQETSAVEGITALEGSINVANAQGGHIGKVTRTYMADSKTGQYIDASRPHVGYLFAPRNMREGQSFFYQHILYSAVARMEYTGKEVIDGLGAYRYQAIYGQPDVVPIGNITNAKIPAGKTLLASPHITIWIEPRTGWLLKYREDSTVNIVDTMTRTLTSPLYRFTASFTDSSVHQQTQYAKNLKSRSSASQRIIPITLGMFSLIAGVVLFYSGRTARQAIRAVRSSRLEK